MTKEKIAVVTNFFAEPYVAALEMEGNLKIGDKIRIKGATTDFEQIVESIEIAHESKEEVKKGDDVGIKVNERVRPNDEVFKVKKE